MTPIGVPLLGMDLFVIGDVHGCYHTFLELLQHWQPKKERLIQLGDLTDRGNFAPECVALAMELSEKHPEQAVFLKGNHEAGMLDYYSPDDIPTSWPEWGGSLTIDQYDAQPDLLEAHLTWIKQRPLFWENDHVFASHAGISDTLDPFDEESSDSVLWYRGRSATSANCSSLATRPSSTTHQQSIKNLTRLTSIRVPCMATCSLAPAFRRLVNSARLFRCLPIGRIVCG
ncbi:metallophosphoesterase family protein [Hymenobacter volaticus]|uniref:Serine/threonine protein phosphatase n=1 Tax=Hymenobacter volaticus TaxID=2932254 RepID=A0ABY4G299_9BACT|nr:metallophosphoesterase family protein [Hymenobacter volaticus]UOQ64982.1 serine/threonine protein phosphatase [Hymenobacter volaticus]